MSFFFNLSYEHYFNEGVGDLVVDVLGGATLVVNAVKAERLVGRARLVGVAQVAGAAHGIHAHHVLKNRMRFNL